MNCKAYQRCHFLRLYEFSVFVLRRVTLLEGDACFSLPCWLFFLPAILWGATIEGELFPAPPPSWHPIVVLLEGCMVVMDVHCTWNLSALSLQGLLPDQIVYTDLFSIWDCCILVRFYAYVCVLRVALVMQGRGCILRWFKLSCSHLSLLLFTDAL